MTFVAHSYGLITSGLAFTIYQTFVGIMSYLAPIKAKGSCKANDLNIVEYKILVSKLLDIQRNCIAVTFYAKEIVCFRRRIQRIQDD